jgi:CheY-like chemotaxis protein
MTELHATNPKASRPGSIGRGSVLVVDHDRDVAGLVADVLEHAGFSVVELLDSRRIALQEQLAQLEPDVILLDAEDNAAYGESWSNAAWLRECDPPNAVIMFTAHASDLAEARLGQSERSQSAGFVDFLSKPFELEDLVDSVVRAVGQHAAGAPYGH